MNPPKYQNELSKDKHFEAWKKSLSIKAASRYQYGIIAYCEFTKKTCSELIKEAQEDYIKHVPPWDLKHIKHIDAFIQSFKDNSDMSNWTKLGFINAVRNFYRFNKIPVEGINKPSIPAMAREAYLDIPVMKLDDIRKAVLSCGVDEKLTKALILTFLSSGQAQAEVHKLQGRHLKNVINGIAVVNMTRGKTNRRFTFFIGSEALQAIHDYKPVIGDDDFVFTQKRSAKPLNDTYIVQIFKRLSAKLNWKRSYFQAHRFRHYFKSQLSGSMDSTFIEYFLGHKLPGVESHYFLGNQDKMIEAYLKNQHLLSVFTDQETLQKQYDDLKQKHVVGNEELKAKIAEMEADKAKQQEKQQADMDIMKTQIASLMQRITDDVTEQQFQGGMRQDEVEKLEKFAEELPKKIRDKARKR